jgi:hypothetical protein
MLTARLYDNHRKYYSNRQDFFKKLEKKTDAEIYFPSVPARVHSS